MNSDYIQPPKEALLRIRAKINVGEGNRLVVYGNWESDTWEKGIEMFCILPDLWEAIVTVRNSTARLIEFKVKLNDTQWETGANHAGYPNSQVEFTPYF